MHFAEIVRQKLYITNLTKHYLTIRMRISKALEKKDKE